MYGSFGCWPLYDPTSTGAGGGGGSDINMDGTGAAFFTGFEGGGAWAGGGGANAGGGGAWAGGGGAPPIPPLGGGGASLKMELNRGGGGMSSGGGGANAGGGAALSNPFMLSRSWRSRTENLGGGLSTGLLDGAGGGGPVLLLASIAMRAIDNEFVPRLSFFFFF